MQQLRLQPFPFVAERVIRRTVFPEAIRSAIGREVPHQGEVAPPDFSIAGILGHAEHGEWITHQKNSLQSTFPPRLGRPFSTAFATIAWARVRITGSGMPGT